MSSNIRVQRICKHCQNEFTARTTITQYCGDTCAKKAYKARMRNKKIESSEKETIIQKTAGINLVQAKDFLTVRDTSKLLSCSIRTTYRLIESGVIKGVRLTDRKTLIKRSEIDKLFN